jgi:protein-tyrosine sulfotransferase
MPSIAQLLLFGTVVFLILYISRGLLPNHLEDNYERHQRALLAHYTHGNHSDDMPLPLVFVQKNVPLIWIGGVPRSGTTLMRAMMDAHPDVRCGEETRVIPRILGIHQTMMKSEMEVKRLEHAHITEEVLDNALAAYVLSIISSHGEQAPRLCNKDPFALRSMKRISSMFPQSKFILMLRDGRATVHSIISRKVSIRGFDVSSYRGGLKDWNRAISTMYSECLAIGSSHCLPVHYEQLVLHPKAQMEKILKWLDIPWSALVLEHEKMIGENGGVSLSKYVPPNDFLKRFHTLVYVRMV